VYSNNRYRTNILINAGHLKNCFTEMTDQYPKPSDKIAVRTNHILFNNGATVIAVERIVPIKTTSFVS
jgi:hypothetical protein